MMETMERPAVLAGATIDVPQAHLPVESPTVAVMPQPVQVLPADPGLALLQVAMQRGASVEELDKLMNLRARLKAEHAEQLFLAAFAAFKAEAIVIIKHETVNDGPLRGKRYAKLHDVVNAVTPALSRHGLRSSWKITRDDRDWIEITCTLSHVGGYSETVSMGAAPDTGPGRNAIQARASAVSYLERYTLKAILGVAEQEDDDDGNGGGDESAAANKLLNEIKAEARATTTDADALAVWKRRNADLASWGWAHQNLKDFIGAHRDALKGGAK